MSDPQLDVLEDISTSLKNPNEGDSGNVKDTSVLEDGLGEALFELDDGFGAVSATATNSKIENGTEKSEAEVVDSKTPSTTLPEIHLSPFHTFRTPVNDIRLEDDLCSDVDFLTTRPNPPLRVKEFPPQPVHATGGHTNDNDDDDVYARTQYTRFQWKTAPKIDRFVALALVGLQAVVVFLALLYRVLDGVLKFNTGSEIFESTYRHILITACLFGVFSGLSWGFLWINMPSLVVKITYVVSIAAVSLLSVVFLSSGILYWILGLSLLGLVVGLGCWIYNTRSREAFAGALLDVSAEIARESTSTFQIVGAVIILVFLKCIVWSIFMVSAIVMHTHIFKLVLFADLYWSMQVARNIVNVTLAGTAARWYFKTMYSLSDNPSEFAFKRACSTSLGSIALGSLVEPLVRNLRSFFNVSRKLSSVPKVVEASNLAMQQLDPLLEQFNKFAFPQIAMYGKSWTRSSQDAWNTILDSNLEGVVNEDIIEPVAYIGCSSFGIVMFMLAFAWTYAAGTDYCFAVAFISFWLVFFISQLFTEVAEACVSTIYACYAEEPEHLAHSQPVIFHRLARVADSGSHIAG